MLLFNYASCRLIRETGQRLLYLLSLLEANDLFLGADNIIYNIYRERDQRNVFLFCVGTWPAGDIVLEHGNPLHILCILNQTFIESSFPGKNSSDLVFFKGQRKVEPEFISVVNETAIRLDVSEPPPENAMYYCKLRLDETYDKDYEAVCLNKVVVGCTFNFYMSIIRIRRYTALIRPD